TGQLRYAPNPQHRPEHADQPAIDGGWTGSLRLPLLGRCCFLPLLGALVIGIAQLATKNASKSTLRSRLRVPSYNPEIRNGKLVTLECTGTLADADMYDFRND